MSAVGCVFVVCCLFCFVLLCVDCCSSLFGCCIVDCWMLFAVCCLVVVGGWLWFVIGGARVVEFRCSCIACRFSMFVCWLLCVVWCLSVVVRCVLFEVLISCMSAGVCGVLFVVFGVCVIVVVCSWLLVAGWCFCLLFVVRGCWVCLCVRIVVFYALFVVRFFVA